MFESLIGNIEVKKILRESIQSNNIPHSFIFSGIEGIGKKLFAREYAKNIMCLENGNCKNTCDSCIKFDSKSHPDFIEINPDGKAIKIDQIRNMQERIAEKPIISNKKVYIINNADFMTEESQNCLLKTLEEPPEYAIIVLVTSNESKLLATIKSRCVFIKFNKISNEELHNYFNEFSENQIKLLNGSFQNSATIKEREEEYESLKKIVELLQKGTILELIECAEILYKKKENILEMLNSLNIILLEKNILEPIKFVEKTKRKIIANNNYEMSIDYLLINSWKVVNS